MGDARTPPAGARCARYFHPLVEPLFMGSVMMAFGGGAVAYRPALAVSVRRGPAPAANAVAGSRR